LSPTDGTSIYDPACGTGGLLIESARYIKGNSLNKNFKNKKYDFVLTNPPFGKKSGWDNIHIDTHYKGPNLDY
ncbi:N-6 DNA methylase, partial [Escherichia coli]|nr:N-6 DNA methylase [Escherichia coli]